MTQRTCLGIILAAGEGTRMKSAIPKVLHPVGGLPLVGHVTMALHRAGVEQIALVIGPAHDAVASAAARIAPDLQVFIQKEQRGTAHAVLAAGAALAAGHDDILVVFADTPLVTAETVDRLRAGLSTGKAVVVAGMRPRDPSGYGRLVMDADRLLAIREDKDASVEERRIGFCNGGIMGLDGGQALAILQAIGRDNAQGEYYLTDAVSIANERGLAVGAVEIDETEVFGINDRAQLADAEARFQAGRRRDAMRSGVTLVAPDSVYFSHDTVIERDVVVEPHVVFAPGVSVASGAIIRAFSHLEGATVGPGAVIGPFARLRPGAMVSDDARVGNFVEVKNAVIGPRAKVNHLSYIGDAAVGARANIGAGTITCNYDGFGKYRTEIGEAAFVGSNSALVAPVTIGAGSYVASGSVITRDVSPDALAVARGRQVEKPGWAGRRRAVSAAKKGD